MASVIQITNPNNFNIFKLHFSDPINGTVQGKDITFKRIAINIDYPDGATGPLIIPTPHCFSKRTLISTMSAK